MKKKQKELVEQIAEDLFNYAIDHEYIKALVSSLPEDRDIKRSLIEYELEILRIISVGWSITYFMAAGVPKDSLNDSFWKSVHEFSKSLSRTTELMIGKNIDYFNILRERLDIYLAAMGKNIDAKDPAAIIGPEFAKACGDADNVYLVMVGSRLFISVVTEVKKYLEEVKLR